MALWKNPKKAVVAAQGSPRCQRTDWKRLAVHLGPVKSGEGHGLDARVLGSSPMSGSLLSGESASTSPHSPLCSLSLSQ